MDVNIFISTYRVKPADAVVLTKKFFGMVDHFVVYIGIRNAEHQFVANFIEGVRVIPRKDIDKWLSTYVPTDVDRFPGPEHTRGEALKRAMSKIGESAYNYIANNCEHFKNFVHHGIATSSQVTKAGVAVAVGGAGVALLGLGKKHTGMAVWGLLILLIGVLVAALGSGSDNDDHTKKCA